MPKTCPICNTTYPDTSAFCPTDGTTLRADENSTDLIGSVIADRYLISKLLGEGGMGRVYLAGHVRLPQQAAIKVLHPSMVQDSAAVARFNREAANAARIEHERVARVFDFGETSNGLVYLAMEFVPGRTLRDILEEQPCLPPARAAHLIYQVAEGLDAAHRMSIVHRDLKPDNIMVITEESGIDRAKVVDFGIAKVVDGTPGQRTQLTVAGSVVGTPEFMSPEQVFGEPLDARSDVYALALVGYQMLTGLLPFDSSTPERSLTARIVSDPRTLAEGRPEVSWPAELQAAFDRALAREPDARTASALDFADAVVVATEAWIGAPVLRTRTPLSNTALNASGGMRAIAPTPSVTPAVASPAASAAPTVTLSTPAATSAAGASGGGARGMILGGLGVALVAAAVYIATSGGADGPTAATNADSTLVSDNRSAVPGNGRDESAGRAIMPTRPPDTATPRTADASSNGASSTSLTQGGDGSRDASSPSANAAAPGAGAGSEGGAVRAPAEAQSPAGADALRSLEIVKKALAGADETDQVATAAQAIPELQRLLVRLPTAIDSTWAYIYLVNAYGMANETARACVPLRAARRLANTDAQLRAVTALENSLTCTR